MSNDAMQIGHEFLAYVVPRGDMAGDADAGDASRDVSELSCDVSEFLRDASLPRLKRPVMEPLRGRATAGFAAACTSSTRAAPALRLQSPVVRCTSNLTMQVSELTRACVRVCAKYLFLRRKALPTVVVAVLGCRAARFLVARASPARRARIRGRHGCVGGVRVCASGDAPWTSAHVRENTRATRSSSGKWSWRARRRARTRG